MTFPSLRFLVAEDHEFQRQVIVGMLKRLGVQAIHEAADGRAAPDVIEDPARPVDVVVSDLEMPGMDGMEFIRHLGQAGAGVSLILASALERKLLASIATMTEATASACWASSKSRSRRRGCASWSSAMRVRPRLARAGPPSPARASRWHRSPRGCARKNSSPSFSPRSRWPRSA